MGESQRQKVEEFRRRVISPFAIRGTIRDRSFSTSRRFRTGQDPIPAYLVRPLEGKTSREWVSHLHATIHAAIARPMIKLPRRYEIGKTPKELLPIIMVFGPPSFSYRKTSGKRGFLMSRRFSLDINPKSRFSKGVTHYRKQYEEGIVHGRKRPTFMESDISGGYGLDGKFQPSQKKLFEVRLTAKEYDRVLKKIGRKLQKRGFTLKGLSEKYALDMNQRSWNRVLRKIGEGRIQLTQETTPHWVANYLVYLEISRILTNKLVARGIKWVERNVPEKN